MNSDIEKMLNRRSCKRYLPDPVPEDIIRQVVEAGLYAASGMNRQSAVIMVVTDPAVRSRLSVLNAKYDLQKRPDPFYGAPVVLPVLADSRIVTHVFDGSLALGNMMLAAHYLGMGSCWVHRAKEVFEDPEGKEILKMYQVPEYYAGVGNLILGYPEVLPKAPLSRREGRVFLGTVPKGTSDRANAVLLHPADNVVTVTAAVAGGDRISFESNGELCEVMAADDIPAFHKAAIKDIPAGDPVIKYGETIGKAAMDIRKGAHVHVHNVS